MLCHVHTCRWGHPLGCARSGPTFECACTWGHARARGGILLGWRAHMWNILRVHMHACTHACKGGGRYGVKPHLSHAKPSLGEDIKLLLVCSELLFMCMSSFRSCACQALLVSWQCSCHARVGLFVPFLWCWWECKVLHRDRCMHKFLEPPRKSVQMDPLRSAVHLRADCVPRIASAICVCMCCLTVHEE